VQYQNLLSEVNNKLGELADQPQAQHLQTNFAAALDALRKASEKLLSKFEPSQAKRFEEIGAGRFFVEDLPENISKLVRDNPI